MKTLDQPSWRLSEDEPHGAWRVSIESRRLHGVTFIRDKRGRWHLTSYDGHSAVHAIEMLRCPRRWCRGYEWRHVAQVVNADGPPVVLSVLGTLDDMARTEAARRRMTWRARRAERRSVFGSFR